MVQLEIISGKSAGAKWLTRRFPVLLGRSDDAQFRLEDPGVWDKHVQIKLDPQQGFLLCAEGEALVTVNGQGINQAVLRNGDQIEIGGARIRFWLAPAEQRSLAVRELLFWMLLVAVSGAQVALIYTLVL